MTVRLRRGRGLFGAPVVADVPGQQQLLRPERLLGLHRHADLARVVGEQHVAGDLLLLADTPALAQYLLASDSGDTALIDALPEETELMSQRKTLLGLACDAEVVLDKVNPTLVPRTATTRTTRPRRAASRQAHPLGQSGVHHCSTRMPVSADSFFHLAISPR